MNIFPMKSRSTIWKTAHCALQGLRPSTLARVVPDVETVLLEAGSFLWGHEPL